MGLKKVWVIAKNTFREIFRDRILYGLLVFAVLLLGLSLALGQLSFTEQSRIAINFGFSAIELSAAILSIFVGSTLVRREIEKKTIMTLLARPVSRYQFVVGKSLGLMGIIIVSAALLALFLALILAMMKLPLNMTFFAGIYGVLLEAMVLLSFTIFFGTFSSPIMSVSFTIGIFLIGHWLDSLKFFADKSQSPVFINFAKVVRATFPNLEWFNWRSLFIYGDPLPSSEILIGSAYSMAWTVLLISIAAYILGNKDLG